MRSAHVCRKLLVKTSTVLGMLQALSSRHTISVCRNRSHHKKKPSTTITYPITTFKRALTRLLLDRPYCTTRKDLPYWQTFVINFHLILYSHSIQQYKKSKNLTKVLRGQVPLTKTRCILNNIHYRIYLFKRRRFWEDKNIVNKKITVSYTILVESEYVNNIIYCTFLHLWQKHSAQGVDLISLTLQTHCHEN